MILKKMKFFVPIIICVCTFTACVQVKGECGNCGEIKPLYSFKLFLPDGSESEDIVCENCANEMKEFVDSLNKLGVGAEYYIEEYTGK